MFGLDPKILQQIQQNGKLIKGKGTGTSDDIKMTAPKGSYILPADTTAQLGLGKFAPPDSPYRNPEYDADNLPPPIPPQLRNGKPIANNGSFIQEHIPRTEVIDINVSNGEYILPPHAVERIGQGNLDDIREITHQPVRKEPVNNKGAFFADGGRVGGIGGLLKDSSKLKRNFFGGGMTGTSYLEDEKRKRESAQRLQAGTPLTNAANVATVSNPFDNSPDINKPTSWADNPGMQKVFSTPSDKQVSTDAQINALSGKDVYGNTANTNAPVVPFGTKVEKIDLPDYKNPTATEMAMRQFSNIAQRGQDALKNLGQARMPSAPSRTWEEENQRQSLINRLSTVQNGARGITAAQMRGLQELTQGDDNLRQNVYNQQMNMSQAQMKEQGDTVRQNFAQQMAMGKAMLDEAGQDDRLQAQLGFDANKFRETMALDRDKLSQQGLVDLFNANTSRMNADTSQLAASKKGQLSAKDYNERLADFQNKDTTIDSANGLVNSLLNNDAGLKGATGGWFDAYMPNLKDTTKKFESDRKALLSQTYLANSDLLKGVLTDKDAEELKNAFGNLQDKTVSENDFKANLQQVASLMAKMKEANKVRYADVVPQEAKASPTANPKDEHPAAKYFQ